MMEEKLKNENRKKIPVSSAIAYKIKINNIHIAAGLTTQSIK
jgi:hypothetical protein